jgi:glutamyl-Q tRNA(Asp) synthetase
LHLGSLVTAAASYLEARCRGGRWLLRIEDLDTPRVVPGGSDGILRTLDALGFSWDGKVWYQSQRLRHYDAALLSLQNGGFLYDCSCTRRERGAADDSGGYPGTCRNGARNAGPTALRFRADLPCIEPIVDSLQGEIAPARFAAGDPIVRRRDGLHAYQLAVVVDDAASGVSDIVRGADLLPSSYWQRALQSALQLPTVTYAHVPLVTEADGSKLSKSAHALTAPMAENTSAAPGTASATLHRVLTLLRQDPPGALSRAPVPLLWEWALAHWHPERLQGIERLEVGSHVD